MSPSVPGICSHIKDAAPGAARIRPSADGCEDCLRVGGHWVHLRLCMRCGHVGCCDQSPHKHATKHFHETKHPVIRSFEQGERWGYCYPDDAFVEVFPPE